MESEWTEEKLREWEDICAGIEIRNFAIVSSLIAEVRRLREERAKRKSTKLTDREIIDLISGYKSSLDADSLAEIASWIMGKFEDIEEELAAYQADGPGPRELGNEIAELTKQLAKVTAERDEAIAELKRQPRDVLDMG